MAGNNRQSVKPNESFEKKGAVPQQKSAVPQRLKNTGLATAGFFTMLGIAEGNDKVPELTNAPKTEITANKAKEDLVATQSVESPEEAQKGFMKGIDSLLNDQDTLANIAGLISEQMSTQGLDEVATAEDIREMMTEFKSGIRFEKQAPKLDYMADNKSIHKNPNQTFAYTPSTNNPPANFGININAGYQVILAETNISNAVIEGKLQFHESRGVNPYLGGKFILGKNPDENFVGTEYNYGRYVDFTGQFGVLGNVMNLTKAGRFQVESDSYVGIGATQANVTIDQERKEEDRGLGASQNKTGVMTFGSNIRLSANPSSLAALKQGGKSRSAAKFFIEGGAGGYIGENLSGLGQDEAGNQNPYTTIGKIYVTYYVGFGLTIYFQGNNPFNAMTDSFTQPFRSYERSSGGNNGNKGEQGGSEQ